jgi:ankyrin repeat protein
LRESDVDLNAGDYDRRTPLHTAVRAEKFDAVRYLVNTAQVKVNQIDRWGATPLSYAVKGSEIYLFLLSRGA